MYLIFSGWIVEDRQLHHSNELCGHYEVQCVLSGVVTEGNLAVISGADAKPGVGVLSA